MAMNIATPVLAAALAALASACAPDNDRHSPSYGAPQGYRFPYGVPYGGAGPGPTISLDSAPRHTSTTLRQESGRQVA